MERGVSLPGRSKRNKPTEWIGRHGNIGCIDVKTLKTADDHRIQKQQSENGRLAECRDASDAAQRHHTEKKAQRGSNAEKDKHSERAECDKVCHWIEPSSFVNA